MVFDDVCGGGSTLRPGIIGLPPDGIKDFKNSVMLNPSSGFVLEFITSIGLPFKRKKIPHITAVTVAQI
jgi:hypothetical protein